MRRLLAPAVVGCAVALVAAACGGGSSSPSSSSSGGGGANTASAPGITATNITIGSHQPLTGVAAPGYDEIAPSSKALFDDVNAHGGVNGRKITYTYQDDAYNPTQTATVVRSLVLQDNVFGIFNGLGTPTHLAVQQFLNTERVPDLFVASGCDCWNNPGKFPYTSGYQTDYTIEGKITGQYVKNTFPGKKVGYLYQNDDFGQGGIQGLDQQIPKSSVVTRQNYVPTNLDVGPQVAALQASGAQVAVLYTVPPFTALTIGAAAKIGYHPQWVTSSVSADPTTVGNLLKGTSMLEGLVSSSYLPSPNDTSNPWVQTFMRIHNQYVPNLPFDGNTIYGMSVAYTFVKLMQQAGTNPTRQSVVNALKTANLAGPGLVPISYSSTSGFTGVQMGTITGGKFVLSGPRFTATDNGPIGTFNGTQPPPPSNL
ncbi:MAG TPA: ABC transporter substrate-binding protein [Acidimicrobiales bacterium]|nr:ABC transporter substrate-binding protein [Acidimicrobiales bacterium]